MYACCAHKSKQIRSFKSSIILNMHIYFSETKKRLFFLGGGGVTKITKYVLMWRPPPMPSFEDLILINFGQNSSLDTNTCMFCS